MITWSDISGFIDDIKSALWSWVDDIARYWVQRAYEFYDILKHTWDDILDAVERAKSYAEWLLEDVWNEFDRVWERIGAIPVITYDVVVGWVKPFFEHTKSYAEDIVSNALKTVDNLVNDIWKDISKVWDRIDDILTIQIPDLRNNIQNALNWIGNVDNWIDNKINEFRERIEGWIEESFITIIEHVMEMEIGGRK
ncbi:MAG: hypothetical protein QIT46_gp11 [Methanophagales virus PBV305]|uniref:Tail tape measure protein n=1 Tax=Methanophagales virus PBV305 TaxID=3071310 RepID=A0AA46YJC8_9VIRU|nr:MAG: hypothetical protein QIT46_gp11 [Methanophagales virus PBV305]UYL65063.1 MAG: hypothetical protein HJKPNNFO_00011 [Methanophagales virus PBV305]